jgi:hypothetical protein
MCSTRSTRGRGGVRPEQVPDRVRDVVHARAGGDVGLERATCRGIRGRHHRDSTRPGCPLSGCSAGSAAAARAGRDRQPDPVAVASCVDGRGRRNRNHDPCRAAVVSGASMRRTPSGTPPPSNSSSAGSAIARTWTTSPACSVRSTNRRSHSRKVGRGSARRRRHNGTSQSCRHPCSGLCSRNGSPPALPGPASSDQLVAGCGTSVGLAVAGPTSRGCVSTESATPPCESWDRRFGNRRPRDGRTFVWGERRLSCRGSWA